MRTGTTATGEVVVQNNTGRALQASGCGSTFALALTSATYQPQVGWLRCLTNISFPPGRSTYNVTLVASYLACTRGTPSSTLPSCLPSGQAPPLPPGDYRAVLFQNPSIAPSPPARPIHLTPQQ